MDSADRLQRDAREEEESRAGQGGREGAAIGLMLSMGITWILDVIHDSAIHDESSEPGPVLQLTLAWHLSLLITL